MSQAVSNKGLATACHWLFFQNAIQVQLHGGKNPIVLYWEMKLQSDLHVSNEPAATSLQRFNWSGAGQIAASFPSTIQWGFYHREGALESRSGRIATATCCDAVNLEPEIKTSSLTGNQNLLSDRPGC